MNYAGAYGPSTGQVVPELRQYANTLSRMSSLPAAIGGSASNGVGIWMGTTTGLCRCGAFRHDWEDVPRSCSTVRRLRPDAPLYSEVRCWLHATASTD